MIDGKGLVGNRGLLETWKLGVFCSVRCPGIWVVALYELVGRLRDMRVTLMSGFHSPMERECLRLILRGYGPAIVCRARTLERLRAPPEWHAPMERGTLLVVSALPDEHGRLTRDLAARRNAYVADVSDAVLVAYAAPGGATERMCDAVVRAGKVVYTFDPRLGGRGATMVTGDDEGARLIAAAAGMAAVDTPRVDVTHVTAGV